MKTFKFIATSSVALAFGVATSQAQIVQGATNTVKSVASGATNVASNVAGSTISGAKSLLSMPGKAMSINDGLLPELSAGTQEFGLGGNIQIGGEVTYNLALSYGYFFKDNWEVGFNADLQGSDASLSLGVGLFTEYNFDFDSKWVPYVGASVSLASLSTDDGISVSSDVKDVTSVALGGEFGVKYFVRQNIAIYFAANFQWSPDDVFGGLEDAAAAAGNINVGTRFYF